MATKAKAPKMKNVCGKSRKKDAPYEIWKNYRAGWTWCVLKKWQADDNKEYARWYCFVKSPMCPEGEYGDVYVADIKQYATRIYVDPVVKAAEDEFDKALLTALES